MEKHKATRLLGEASSSGNIHHVWKSIWGLHIKRKIQHFMWRCAHNILPTNLALCQRKVLADPWCPRCGVELETLDHLLLRCPDSQLVWKCSPLRLEWPPHITLDCFSEWWQYLEHLFASLEHGDKNLQLVCYICWALWKSRNAWVFSQIRQLPPSISSLAVAEWIEFSVALDLPPRDQASSLPSVSTAALSHVSPPITRWLCPPCGYIKLNVDASTRERAFRAGIGIVGRTSVGAILFIKSIPLFTCPSPRVLEALAVREALQQVLFGQHRNIIVEGDAKVVYQSLNGAMQPPQDIAVIVQDCRTLSLSFNSVCFSFVPRLCNGVAHDIAHHALSIDEARVWDVCFPSWCLHSHQSDIGSLYPL
ncbi:putative ribonuclease H protein [Camellia lanceoleosa]|uniref:Ribonuclease H protein n=1 Tax=Camellia lanceoleosa TaxID=1840588 RepID=A0ACC0IK41_9ERIC|nr:putative ribonuclease H protein [Camellia lanceoleosa]